MTYNDERRAPLQVDLYGVRVEITPNPESATEPDSWRAVARRLNRELMSIATNTVVLFSQTLKSAISLVRGVGDLPSAMNDRISRAHDAADLAEDAALHAGSVATDHTKARARLQQIVKELEATGLTVTLAQSDGRLVVALLPPSPPEQVESTVAAALRELGSVTLQHRCDEDESGGEGSANGRECRRES